MIYHRTTTSMTIKMSHLDYENRCSVDYDVNV